VIDSIIEEGTKMTEISLQNQHSKALIDNIYQ
jgi:hypothetical protein